MALYTVPKLPEPSSVDVSVNNVREQDWQLTFEHRILTRKGAFRRHICVDWYSMSQNLTGKHEGGKRIEK